MREIGGGRTGWMGEGVERQKRGQGWIDEGVG